MQVAQGGWRLSGGAHRHIELGGIGDPTYAFAADQAMETRFSILALRREPCRTG
jgi:hypothetical protein